MNAGKNLLEKSNLLLYKNCPLHGLHRQISHREESVFNIGCKILISFCSVCGPDFRNFYLSVKYFENRTFEKNMEILGMNGKLKAQTSCSDGLCYISYFFVTKDQQTTEENKVGNLSLLLEKHQSSLDNAPWVKVDNRLETFIPYLSPDDANLIHQILPKATVLVVNIHNDGEATKMLKVSMQE